MTRINIISPTELTDQHLVAEYREIEMVPASLERSLRTKSVPEILRSIPKNFTLNKGHVLFFYPRMKYLRKRLDLLVEEMKTRGMTPDMDRYQRVAQRMEKQPKSFQHDWEPTLDDAIIIRERIEQKIAMKPNWYRKKEYQT